MNITKKWPYIQTKPYNCAAFAILNALHTIPKFKAKLQISVLEKLCKTDKHGANSDNVTLALKKLGYLKKSKYFTEDHTIFRKLDVVEKIMDGRKHIFIMGYFVKNEGHYVAGIIDNSAVITFNNLPDKDLVSKNFKNHKKVLVMDMEWLIKKVFMDKTDLYILHSGRISYKRKRAK
jgi:hypothetical protein